MAEGGSCQDTKRNQLSESHSRSGDGRGRDLSGCGKKLTEWGELTSWRQQKEGLIGTRKKPTKRDALTNWRGRGRNLSRHGNKLTKQGALTSWRRQREGLVRTENETDRAKGTHTLEPAEGGTCQDTEANRPSETYSQTGDGRARGLSGHRKKLTERGALTNWRQQR